MVNLFRRYQQAVMVSVTLVTIVTFIGFYSKSDFLDKGGTGRVAMIYSRGVTAAEAQKVFRKGELAQQLGMQELYLSLAGFQRNGPENYIWNSMVLAHEAKQLGVEPSEDEIFEAIKAMPAFQADGAYNSTKYSMMTQLLLTPRGFTTDDLRDLVADSLRLRKIKSILGATVAPSDIEIREDFTRVSQKTQASVIRFKFDDFLAAANVSDEDVKKLYDERKDSLKTEEQRKVKYVAFALPVTDKPLEGPAKAEALAKIQKQAEDFAVAMAVKDAKLDEEAAKAGVKVQETPDFTPSKPPEALDSSREIAGAAFKLTQKDPNSDALAGKSGYFVLQLAGTTPPRQLTLDEAKAELTGTLKQERAQEALNLKATEVRNKIEADMKAGKNFNEAAQAEGVKAEEFPTFSIKDQPKTPVPNSNEIMQAALEMNEGELSKPTPASDGSLIIYVAKHLPIDEKELAADKSKIAEGISQRQQFALFQEWLKLRRAAAHVQENNAKG